MKRLKFVPLMMLLLAGCGGGGGASSPSGGSSTKAVASIAVSPEKSTVVTGAPVQFVATATYSDATTEDITASVTWQSSKPAVATISNDAASRGKATAVADGTTTITAVTGSISGSTDLTVFTANPLTDIFLGGEHHVGDGRWGYEPVNSHIPVEDNVQQTYKVLFDVTDQQKQYASATITLEHRGIESSQGYKDVVILNSTVLDLPNSRADGSYTAFSVKVPTGVFLTGQNSVTVQSGNSSLDPKDYDDFQFQNILIKFSN